MPAFHPEAVFREKKKSDEIHPANCLLCKEGNNMLSYYNEEKLQLTPNNPSQLTVGIVLTMMNG